MNRINLILGLIISISFLFHLIILTNSSITFFSDDAIYASLAKFFSEGNFAKAFHPTWPPLFPALSALVYFFIQDWEISLRVISMMAGVLIIIPLFFFIKQNLSTHHALLFSLSITFFYPLLNFSLLPLSDSLSMLMIVWAIVVISSCFNSFKKIFIGGVLTGFIFLTRSEGAMFFHLFLSLIAFYLIIHIFLKKKLELINLAGIPIFVIAFLLIISPYAIATRNQLGYWTLSQKFSAQIKQNHAFALRDGTAWAQEVTSIKSPNYKSEYFRNGTTYLLDRFDYFARLFNQKVASWKDIFLSFFPSWSVLLIGVGILNIFRKKLFWTIFFIIFLFIIAIPATIFTTPIADVRYLLWIFPFLIYFFYLGLITSLTILLEISKIKLTRFLKLAIILLPFIASLTLPSFYLEGFIHPLIYARTITKVHNRSELKDTAKWINENSQKSNPKIMMRHEMLEFYANGETIYLPQTSLEEVVSYAKKNKVDYLVAWKRELIGENDLTPLFDSNFQHPMLERVYSIQTKDGPLIIYSLL